MVSPLPMENEMRQRIKDTITGTILVVLAFSTVPLSLAMMFWMLGV